MLGADAESYPVAERSDYAAATGSSTAGSSGSGYITVTPLPDILYTERQSGIPATWTRYEVTITIQGTPFTLSFTKGDTAAKVIENVPTGSTVSARARISVESTTPTAGLGYTELTASSASSTTAAGSNTIMMWVQYPVEFVGGGSVTVPAASTYSNGGGNPALALPDPAETGDSIFAGWALSPDGPAAFAPGSAIPAGSYRGRLTLYPWYWGDFTVQETAPESARQTDSTDSGAEYTIRSLTDAFTLSAVAGAGSIPAGTSFSWTISAADTGMTVTKTGATCTVCPSELGLSEAGFEGNAAKTVTVSCTASNSASSTGIARQRSLLLSMKQTPDFSISITPPASYNAANSATTGTVPTYALMDLTGSFTITATPAAGSSFLPGTEFTWTVYGTTLTGAAQKGASVSLSPSAMGLTSTAGQTNSISTSKTSPTTISVSCTAKNDDAVLTSKGADDASVKVFLLTIPDFKVTVQSEPSGVASRTEGTGSTATKIYLPLTADMTDTTKMFTFKAEPKTSGDAFPTGTTFTWSFLMSPTSVTTAGATLSGLTGLTTAPTSAQNIEVTCRATYGSLTKVSDTTTIKLGSPFNVYNLGAYLESLPENDADHPYAISVTGLSLNTWGSNVAESSILINALRNNPGKYVDLRTTELPTGLTGMSNLFIGCPTLVYAPPIPATVTSLNQTFKNCSSLRTPPVIPNGVTDMNECFERCTSLTAAPEIPASVERISSCFAGCGTSLTGNVVIRSTNLTNAHGAFRSLDGNEPTNITAIYVPDETVASQLGTWNDDWIKTVGGTGIVHYPIP